MKKLFSVLMCVMLMLCCASARAESDPLLITSPGEAEELVRTMLGDHPETLDGVYSMTDLLESAVSSMGGFRGLAAALSQFGAIQKVESAYEGQLAGYTVYYVPCIFSNASADILVAVSDGALAGLQTGAYTGGGSAVSEAFESIGLDLPVPALNGQLPGTLTLPEGEGPFPALVLVHGSGPNDRDETLGALKPFRDLAEGLAEKGIAVYRYDKRTYVYGQELANDSQLTLIEETVDDAVAAVRLLSVQPGIDPQRIFVLGHSLGGMAVPAIDLALREQGVPVHGYILMAPSARPVNELMIEQAEYLNSLLPEPMEAYEESIKLLREELDRLKDLDALDADDRIAGAPPAYWRWLFNYDAPGTARKIVLPCLLMQGEEDYQVTMKDYSLWKEAVGDLENWRLVTYPGLTHPFTPGLKTEGSGAYARSGRVSPQVIRDIADFVLEQE